MVISVRVPDEDADRMKVYAVYNGISVSEFLRNTMKKELDRGYNLSPGDYEIVREKIAYETRKKKRRKKKLLKMKQAKLEKEMREIKKQEEKLNLE